jgi:hypothetical protein
MDHRPPWYDRFVDAIPPLPRWFLPLFMLVMLFVLGMIFGYALGARQRVDQRTTAAPQSVIDSRLNSIDQRLNSLDQRLNSVEQRLKAFEQLLSDPSP